MPLAELISNQLLQSTREQSNFVSGGLSQSSRIRPNRLFTADAGIIVYTAGKVSEQKLRETIDRVTTILWS